MVKHHTELETLTFFFFFTILQIEAVYIFTDFSTLRKNKFDAFQVHYYFIYIILFVEINDDL